MGQYVNMSDSSFWKILWLSLVKPSLTTSKMENVYLIECGILDNEIVDMNFGLSRRTSA